MGCGSSRPLVLDDPITPAVPSAYPHTPAHYTNVNVAPANGLPCNQAVIPHSYSQGLHDSIHRSLEDPNTAYQEIEDRISRGADVNIYDLNGQTALHIASDHGLCVFVDLLVQAGADVNAASRTTGETALHYAAKHGYVDVIRSLLMVPGVVSDTQNASGDTPLHDAVVEATLQGRAEGANACVMALLESGANPSASTSENATIFHLLAANGLISCTQEALNRGADPSARDSRGDTPLHYAAKSGQLEIALSLLRYDSRLASMLNASGETPLHTAQAHGQIAMAQCLSSMDLLHAAHSGDTSGILGALGSSADLDDSTDMEGNTAVHIAASQGHADALACMLSSTSNAAELAMRPNIYGDTPLHKAATSGHVEAMQTLLSLVPSNRAFSSANASGMTPLHVAAEAGHFRATRALLNADVISAGPDAGADFIGSLLNQGDELLRNTALHYAAKAGHLETVELLVARGADVNARNKLDETPLHLAAAWDQVAIVKRLLDCGADPQAVNSEAKTPLDVAKQCGLGHLWETMVCMRLLRAAAAGDSTAVSIVLQEGPPSSLINLREFETRDTALHVAARTGHVAIIDQLLAAGADITAQNIDGDAPLHTAVKAGEIDAIDALLAAPNADPDIKTTEGDSALVIAAKEGMVDVIEALGTAGADCNTPGCHQCSALHQAACECNIDVVQALLRFGADPNAKEGLGGNTPLHLVARWGPADRSGPVIEALLTAGADPLALNDEEKTAEDLALSVGNTSMIENSRRFAAMPATNDRFEVGSSAGREQDLVSFASIGAESAVDIAATMPPGADINDDESMASLSLPPESGPPRDSSDTLQLEGLMPKRAAPPRLPVANPTHTQDDQHQGGHHGEYYPNIYAAIGSREESHSQAMISDDHPESNPPRAISKSRRYSTPLEAPPVSPFATMASPPAVGSPPQDGKTQQRPWLYNPPTPCAAAQPSSQAEPKQSNNAGGDSRSATATPTDDRIAFDDLFIPPEHIHLDGDMTIGAGSFGRVYRGTCYGRNVAVKVLLNGTMLAGGGGHSPSMHSDDAKNVALLNHEFQRELVMMSRLRHDNIQFLRGYSEIPDLGLALVSRYYARGSLATLLKSALRIPARAAELPWTRRLRFAADIAAGLQYMHSKRQPIIHRDLKACNCFIDENWNAIVGDFGFTKEVQALDRTRLASSSGAAGPNNPRWMAPELLQASADTPGDRYTTATDVYSYSMMLYELLTWRAPWPTTGHWQLLSMVGAGQRPPIPPPHALPGPVADREAFHTSGALGDYISLMQQGWATDPSERPSFHEIHAQLVALIHRLDEAVAQHSPAQDVVVRMHGV